MQGGLGNPNGSGMADVYQSQRPHAVSTEQANDSGVRCL